MDDAAKIYYAGIFNFNGDGKNEAHYKYNDSGSLIEDTGRGITNIEYDDWNNPKRIQFANGNVTKYVYSAEGEKLRTVHYTAVPNISVPAGTTHRLSTSEILSKDSTDYHGNLIVENGKPDKYLFAGGFASLRNSADGKPEIAFHYYDQDHLGNNRAVVSARTGAVEQITNYYPFGMPYTDQTAVNPDFQKYKYNGKELDKMHGLNTYDYGARQYYSIVPAWDRIDPMCEKYYSISPYVFCGDNPIRYLDINGDSIWISYNNEYYLYQQGKLYYNGKIKEVTDKERFLSTVLSALNTIGSTDSGSDALSLLEASRYNVRINEGNKNHFKEDNRNRASLLKVYPDHGFDNVAGIGGTIYWNPKDHTGGPDENGSTTRSPIIGLSHEIGHAVLAVQGLSDFTFFNNKA